MVMRTDIETAVCVTLTALGYRSRWTESGWNLDQSDLKLMKRGSKVTNFRYQQSVAGA
jgi:hypothetical protein